MASITFRRYLAHLDKGVVPEATIRGLRKLLNAEARAFARSRSGITPAELATLLALIQGQRPKVEISQALKGLAWLKKQDKTSKGTIRQNSPFGHRERNVIENFGHFELVGFIDVGPLLTHYLAVYRVVAKDGTWFEYYNSSWQSRLYTSTDRRRIVITG